MFYNLILVLSLPFVIPAFLLIAAINPRYRSGLAERLGHWKIPSDWSAGDSPCVWIHSASVGEVQAAWPVAEELLKREPTCRMIMTTLTATGRELIRRKLSDSAVKTDRILVRLLPVDLPRLASRLFRRLKPDLLLLVETELWPNLLSAARLRGVPVVIINGRISPRAFTRYRRMRWLLVPALRGIERFLMQTPEDAERIIHLGAPSPRVRVFGNLKFDLRLPPVPDSERKANRSKWGWKASDPVWAAGSTHAGEEEAVISVYLKIKKDYPDFRLILAPRHLERVPEIVRYLERSPLRWVLSDASGNPSGPGPADLVLVNTLGELQKLYALSQMAFVGGSLVPVGGHNLIEPALLGIPVLFGPHIDQVSAMAEMMERSGGGTRIRDAERLETEVRRLLDDPVLGQTMGERARKAVADRQGAVGRTVDLISGLLETARLSKIPWLDQRPMAQRWIEDRLWADRGGLLTGLLSVGFRILSYGYRIVLDFREAGYRIGVMRTRRLSRPVISLGNLTLGGTGKTPAVIALTRILLGAGLRPAVLLRGYGGRNRAPVLEVSDGRSVRWTAEVVGDEPLLLARKLPGIPVLIGRDRAVVGRAAIGAYRPDVLILDDGFQHRRLFRDLDLVLLDGSDPFGNGRVLPAGPLREPDRSLERADAFVLTRVESPEAVQNLVVFLKERFPKQPCFLSRHQLTGYIPLSFKNRISEADPKGPVSKPVFVVSGIARPESLLKSLAQAGHAIVGAWIVPDHHRFTHDEIATIKRQAERVGAAAIVTTEKDAVRLELLGLELHDWWAVRMELSFDDEEALKQLMLSAVKSHG